MPTRNINLTERYDQFVTDLIEAGTYKNASEVLRAGLRLLEEQSQSEEQQLALLKKLAVAGFDSLDQGKGLTLADDQALADAIAEIGRRAANSADGRDAD